MPADLLPSEVWGATLPCLPPNSGTLLAIIFFLVEKKSNLLLSSFEFWFLYTLGFAISGKYKVSLESRETYTGGWEDPLEVGMTTHSNILARRIPWTEEPGGLQSPGS